MPGYLAAGNAVVGRGTFSRGLPVPDHRLSDLQAAPLGWPDERRPSPIARESERVTTLNLGVKGWRFLPHSYAVVNHFQCLEFLRRPEISLSHRDTRFPLALKPGKGLMPAAYEAALWAMTPIGDENKLDVEYRISWPTDFTAAACPRLLVFATYEMGNDINKVIGYDSFAQGHAQSGALVVTPSHWSRDGLIRCGALASRVFVVPLGIDPAIYKPAKAERRRQVRQSLGIDGRFVYLSVGAMTANKGIELLLKAFDTVVQARPNAVLVLKGTDQLYASSEHLGKYLGALGLERLIPNIRYFGGIVSCDEIAGIYGAADAYVTPYYGEGFSLPALEAVACGVPVIATAGGSTDDFIADDFAWKIKSTLVQRENAPSHEYFKQLRPDSDHLIELMVRIFDDRAFRAQARMAGPVHAHKNFSWASSVDRLLAIIDGA